MDWKVWGAAAAAAAPPSLFFEVDIFVWLGTGIDVKYSITRSYIVEYGYEIDLIVPNC